MSYSVLYYVIVLNISLTVLKTVCKHMSHQNVRFQFIPAFNFSTDRKRKTTTSKIYISNIFISNNLFTTIKLATGAIYKNQANIKLQMHWQEGSTVFSQNSNHIQGPLSLYGNLVDKRARKGMSVQMMRSH